MRILFVTDLHGSRWKYARLLDEAESFGAEVVVNGGDLLPHAGELSTQSDFIERVLDDHLAEFDSAGIHYLLCPGNDDLIIFDAMLERTCAKYPKAQYLARRKFEVGGYEFIGMNWVVDYPFLLKDRCRKDTDDYVFQRQLGKARLSTPQGWRVIDDWFSYAESLPTIHDEMNQLVRPSDMASAVYVIHMPPHKLGLDECAGGLEVGSKAIYDFLSTHQPKISLHGHIHESPEASDRWHANLGKTVCVQPGQLDDLTCVTVDLASMEIERIREPLGPRSL